jgi:replicative DNA helicase
MNNVIDFSTEREMFESNTLEEAIVGILLRNPAKLFDVPLEIRWFRNYRKVIEVMFKMVGDGVEIDAVSLAEELPGVPLRTVVDWQRNDFGASANYAGYIDKLKQEFLSTGVKASIESALMALNHGEPFTDVIGGMMSQISGVTTADGQSFTYDAKKALALFVDNLEKTFEARDSGGLGIKIGISALDHVLGGMHPSDMVVVGARPGQGKTAMALTAIMNIARTGKRIGFFSTEMSVTQIMARMASMVSGINAKKIRDADLNDSEYARLTAATIQIQNYPLMICDKPSITVSELVLQARAWDMRGGLDFIVVDYLTRVRPDKATDSRNLDVGEIATGLKNLARILNIPVMVLAQLNRNSTARANKRPMVADLRDSGIIEQEADQVLLLYRPGLENGDTASNLAEVIVDKNRHGECSIVECQFIPHLMQWASFDHEY